MISFVNLSVITALNPNKNYMQCTSGLKNDLIQLSSEVGMFQKFFKHVTKSGHTDWKVKLLH